MLMVLLAAFSRIMPHIPNFSPLGAIGLFDTAYFSEKWQAFLIPIAATRLSDLFISYLLITLAGIFILRKTKPQRVISGALASTAIFFLVSNFSCWIGRTTYPQNLGGLMTCYAAGIPFLKGTLFGDLLYSGVLFGTFALAQKLFPVLRLSNVQS